MCIRDRKNILTVEILKFLVDKVGVPLMEINTNGDSVAHIASRKGCLDIIRYMLEKDASIIVKQNVRGENITSLAAENGHMDIMKYIMDRKSSRFLMNDHTHNNANRNRRNAPQYVTCRPAPAPHAEHRMIGKVVSHSYDTKRTFSKAELPSFLIIATLLYKNASGSCQQRNRLPIALSSLELLDNNRFNFCSRGW